MQVQSQTVQPRLEQRTNKPDEVKNKPQTQTNQASQTKGNENTEKQEQTSAYAKVLSRIENIQGDPELKEKAVTIFSGAIEKRLKEVTGQEQEKILNLEPVKELGIEKMEDFASTIKEGLMNEEKGEKTLALLKNPQFMEFMKDRPKNEAKTYSPNPENAKQGAKTTGKSGETEKQPETSIKLESEAIQKIKTSQAATAMKAATATAPTRQTVA